MVSKTLQTSGTNAFLEDTGLFALGQPQCARGGLAERYMFNIRGFQKTPVSAKDTLHGLTLTLACPRRLTSIEPISHRLICALYSLQPLNPETQRRRQPTFTLN